MGWLTAGAPNITLLWTNFLIILLSAFLVGKDPSATTQRETASFGGSTSLGCSLRKKKRAYFCFTDRANAFPGGPADIC